MSRSYSPDLWSIIEVEHNGEVMQKVLASWFGGYLGSNSWKISSSINEVVELPNAYEFHNESGSIYIGYKNCYGASSYALDVFHNLQRQALLEGGAVKLELLKEFIAD